jgi:methionyl-tRNA formyltransferase
MKYFAITSDHSRHIKFLNMLSSKVKLDLVIVVPKDNKQADEDQFFRSNEYILKRKNVLCCNKMQLHSSFVVNTIRNLQPDVGFVFGAPVLREEIFSLPKFGCVNIHTGLVDHYRGVDSTYWALYDNRPDLIGSTLHFINKGIDTGGVIGTKRVWADLNDTPKTLFYKSCKVGFDLLADNLYNITNNTVKVKTLNKKGKLYQNKDISSQVIDYVNEKTPSLLKEYLSGNHC